MTDEPGSTARSEVGLFALRPGLSIGRYTITSVLGQGGFGITYRARDDQLHRDVAIKEYLPSSLAVRQNGVTVLPRSTEVAQDFTWGRDRFVAEGRTLASLTEAPAIVRVFDFLEDNGTAYIVMELVPGETLEARLRRLGPLSPPEVDALLLPLLDGLEQVHATGFLHRDIKPANILLRTNGRPVLIDFGASRAAMAGRSSLMTAIFTPGFAAAEQMTSAKQGPWTDVYALAATIYLAITGSTPPPAFDRMLEDSYQPLMALRPIGFAPTLLAAIDAGLAVRHNDRPQSIAEWRALLYGSAPAPSPDATVLMRGAASDATVMLSPPSLGNRPSVGAPPSIGTPSPPSVAPPSIASPPAVPPRRPYLLYAGLGALALLLMTGGGYLLQDKPKPQTQTVSLQDLKVEDLEKALEARRKADAEALEKKRLEDEAKARMASDSEAKAKADADLERIKRERIETERELEQLKARLEEQKKVADAQRQAQMEEEQRRAEAAAAEKRRLEDEAQKKADAETRQKAEAEAQVARATAERARADADAKAKQEAETKQKAESDARTRQEAEAREKEKAEKEKQAAEAKAKQDAEDKQLAETAETALRLSPADRQRLQVALTSQGFDTRGSDGAFGPRTREMVAAWQKARNLPATGFVTAAQQQQIQREAAAALQKYDDEQKAGGSYGGSLMMSRTGMTTAAPMDLVLQVGGGTMKGDAAVRRCGTFPMSLTVGADGQVSGTISLADYTQGCSALNFTVTGKVARDTIDLVLTAPGVRGTGTLRKGFVPPPVTDIPSTPDSPQATAPAAATPTPTPPPAASSFDGVYGGSFVAPSTVPAEFNLRVSGTSASGQVMTSACGNHAINLAVSPAGLVSGTFDAFIGTSGCIRRMYTITGRVADGSLQLDLRSQLGTGRAILNKGVAASAPAAPATPAMTWTGSAKCNTWPAPLRISLPAQGGVINSGAGDRSAVTTVTVTGERYEGSIKFTIPNTPKSLTATFAGAVVDRRISVKTVARADFKNLPGASEDFCTLEIVLAQ